MAGQLQNYINNWQRITSDPFINDVLTHCHIDFEVEPLLSAGMCRWGAWVVVIVGHFFPRRPPKRNCQGTSLAKQQSKLSLTMKLNNFLRKA